jgi:hypothetical protein
MYINMNNTYLFISLLCIIILNCFWYAYGTRRREGFNPGKLIDRALGGIVDGLLGGVPILKDIHKKVKKKKGLSKKIETTFYELFISLLTIIFLPLGAVFCVYLSYQLFLIMLANIPMLFQPNSLLSFIC